MRRAAACILALVVSFALVACEQSDLPSPAASAAESPSPSSSSPTPSTQPAVPIISGPCCYGSELAPGTYTTPSWFEARFTIEVSDGLLGVGAELERALMLGRGTSRAGNLERYVGFFVAPSASAVLRQLKATPFTTQKDVVATTVDSMPAQVLEAEAERDPDTPPSDEIVPGAIRIPAIDRLVPTFFYTESVPARMRFVVVDLGDQALLIYLEAPADRFSPFARELAPVLESIRFEP